MNRLRQILLAAAVTLPVLPVGGAVAGPSFDLPRLSFPPVAPVTRACTDPTTPGPDACGKTR